MNDAAGIFVAEAAGFPVGAARIERKDRLEVRRVELRRHQLLGAETRNADHADIAVAPRLPRDPFDQIVAVERARPARFRLDRKSTRLNSSHLGISYAVFCLKTKKIILR